MNNEPKNWQYGDILVFTQDDSVEKDKHIHNRRIEGRLNDIVWTREVWVEDDKKHQSPIEEAIDVHDLHAYGWRCVK